MSATSPATGAAKRAERSSRSGEKDDGDAAAEGGRLAIDLEHARGHHARWVAIGGVIGILCVILLGTLGKALGLVLLLFAARAAYQLVRTFMHPPGTIVVDGEKVSLPRGLCRGDADHLTRDGIGAVYFLRRAVPWTRAAPVLVIEVGERAYLYPRDWFASEADQRRVLETLAPAAS